MKERERERERERDQLIGDSNQKARHNSTNACSSSQCGKFCFVLFLFVFLSQSQLSVQTLLRCPYSFCLFFSPRVNCQCRLSYGVRTVFVCFSLPESTVSADSLTVSVQPPCASHMHQPVYARSQSQTLAAIQYYCLDTWKHCTH